MNSIPIIISQPWTVVGGRKRCKGWCSRSDPGSIQGRKLVRWWGSEVSQEHCTLRAHYDSHVHGGGSLMTRICLLLYLFYFDPTDFTIRYYTYLFMCIEGSFPTERNCIRSPPTVYFNLVIHTHLFLPIKM